MDLGLRDQVAVVVGGANGIGRAIAAALAGEGCRLAVLDSDARTNAIAQELGAQSEVDSRGEVVDVCQEAQVRAAAERIGRAWGACHHVVYAVGAGSGKYGFPFWDLEPADWGRVLEVNLLGAVHAAHAFVGLLRSSSPATMLFLSSIAGQIGSQTDPPYSAAKAALINFAQCAAKDLAPCGVRVNTICPGMVKTDLNRSVWQAWVSKQPIDQRQDYDAWAEEKIRRVAPLGRWQACEDVAALAVFLASPRAANITGQTMNVDGGQVMHW